VKTFEEFVAYCHTLVGQDIAAAGGNTKFRVTAPGRLTIVFVPEGGKPQDKLRPDRVEAVLAKLAATNSYRPGDYRSDTWQASYILGVMARYRDASYPNQQAVAGPPDHRLPAETLRKVSPVHVFEAVNRLLDGESFEPFIESTKYDLLTDDGHRLPPKAVFGKALALALGEETFPGNFSGGEGSVCFEVLRSHGYRVVLKDAQAPLDEDDDVEYSEGEVRLRIHAQRERSPAAAKAKKAEVLAREGILRCERCRESYTEKYGSDSAAAACMEIHHHRLAVSEMPAGYRTSLADLQCLCANCHRVAHHELRLSASDAQTSNLTSPATQ
jgi:hypothetical protein